MVRSQVDVSTLDRLKIALEDGTKSTWNWGALGRPRRPCTDQLWCLEWKCVSLPLPTFLHVYHLTRQKLCGENRWEQAPSAFAKGVRDLLTKRGNALVPAPDANAAEATHYMCLVVNIGGSMRALDIALEENTSIYILDQLSKSYRKRRGVLRTTFSCWRLSRLDVVEVSKYHVHMD